MKNEKLYELTTKLVNYIESIGVEYDYAWDGNGNDYFISIQAGEDMHYRMVEIDMKDLENFKRDAVEQIRYQLHTALEREGHTEPSVPISIRDGFYNSLSIKEEQDLQWLHKEKPEAAKEVTTYQLFHYLKGKTS